MCPVSGINSYNTQDRPRESLHGYNFAPHTSLLMPFTGPVMHLHGLTGSRKAICESTLDYLHTHVHGVPGQYESVALMLSHKWISLVVPIGTVFTNPVKFCGFHGQLVMCKFFIHKMLLVNIWFAAIGKP